MRGAELAGYAASVAPGHLSVSVRCGPDRQEEVTAPAPVYELTPERHRLAVIAAAQFSARPERMQQALQEQAAGLGVQLDIYCMPQWYF